MRIPVFVSCASCLTADQSDVFCSICSLLDELGMEPRTLGRSDYAMRTPLTEVLGVASHCFGGLILGFAQTNFDGGILKPGTPEERRVVETVLPTPWNHLEAGILFALRLPLLILREPGINGGIFDPGTADVFVHNLPSNCQDIATGVVREILIRWAGEVQARYNQ
jgi:hypothetical protein